MFANENQNLSGLKNSKTLLENQWTDKSITRTFYNLRFTTYDFLRISDLLLRQRGYEPVSIRNQRYSKRHVCTPPNRFFRLFFQRINSFVFLSLSRLSVEPIQKSFIHPEHVSVYIFLIKNGRELFASMLAAVSAAPIHYS